MLDRKKWHIESPSSGVVRTYARAKVNLSLSVHAKQPNGFHNLSSILCPISLADLVELRSIENETVGQNIYFNMTFSDELKAHLSAAVDGERNDEKIAERLGLLGDGNLAMKALKAISSLAQEQGKNIPNLRLDLHKRIPFAAGLGGGSADAAAVLLAGVHFFQLDTSDESLFALGAAIGSDVPAILAGHAVLAEGRGERLTDISLPPMTNQLIAALGVLLVRMPIDVSTKDAFSLLERPIGAPPTKALDLTNKYTEKSSRTPTELLDFLTRDRFGTTDYGLTSGGATGISLWPEFQEGAREFFRLLENDFQDPVLTRWPELSSAVQLLNRVGANKVLLAGSGSTMVGLFAGGHNEARVAADSIAALVHDNKAPAKMWGSICPNPLWISTAQFEP